MWSDYLCLVFEEDFIQNLQSYIHFTCFITSNLKSSKECVIQGEFAVLQNAWIIKLSPSLIRGDPCHI